MNDRDRGKGSLDAKGSMEASSARVTELTASLHELERKLADRESLLAEAFNQTEAARSQYSQAVERADALSRRLDGKEQQLKTLQSQLDAQVSTMTRMESDSLFKGTETYVSEAKVTEPNLNESKFTETKLNEKITSLENLLQQRDSRIAFLEQMCAENDNALEAIHGDMDRRDSVTRTRTLGSVSYILESLDNLGKQHRVSRTTTTIGRASTNDIAINSSSISRYHARLVIEPEGLLLMDLKSTNKCRVNAQVVTRRLLSDGDAIMIGEAKFRLSVKQTDAVSAVEATAERPGFDDQMFTHTVVSLHKDVIPELSVPAKV